MPHPPVPKVAAAPTSRQLDVLKLIATTTPPPTFRELGEALGLCPTSIAGHVAELVRKGLVRRYKPNLARQLKPTQRGVRLLRGPPKRSSNIKVFTIAERHELLLADIRRRREAREAIVARQPPAPPPFPEVA